MTPKLTGVAVTSKRRPIRRTLVAVVVLLYALITIGFVASLSNTSSAFVKNGQSFWTVLSKLTSVLCGPGSLFRGGYCSFLEYRSRRLIHCVCYFSGDYPRLFNIFRP